MGRMDIGLPREVRIKHHSPKSPPSRFSANFLGLLIVLPGMGLEMHQSLAETEAPGIVEHEAMFTGFARSLPQQTQRE